MQSREHDCRPSWSFVVGPDASQAMTMERGSGMLIDTKTEPCHNKPATMNTWIHRCVAIFDGEGTDNHWPAIVHRLLAALVFAGLAVVFFLLWDRSEAFAGGGDTVTHYLLSRYSWQFPHFLLDHWGKPVFTLIASPFAQFGLRGVVLMNILLGLTSAWLAFLVARRLKMANAWAVPLLVCFTPVVADTILSGLTEIMFGFFIIWALLLLLDNRSIASAVVISFSLLVRTEGIFIMPLFGLMLLWRKQYRAIPFLLTGFVVYSIAGYFHFKDFFWLITQMPYRGATDVYGTGPLMHYVYHARDYFGVTLSIVVASGLLATAYLVLSGNRTPHLDMVLFVAILFTVYFSAHSVMWWSGIGNSLGLHRHMAAMGPLLALLALLGVNTLFALILDQIPHSMGKCIGKALRFLLTAYVVVLVVDAAFTKYPIPRKMEGVDLVIQQAADFIAEENREVHKVYYYEPAFVVRLNLNPFDGKMARERIYDHARPESQIEPGSFVIWDALFTPLQGLQLETLTSSPYFTMKASFTPDQQIIVFGDREYEIHLFQRNDLAPDLVNSP